LTHREGFSVLRFEGKNAFAAFEPEAGGHRFQRVPPTEKKGRRQSSTVTVAVLKVPTPVELKINKSDLRIEAYTGDGPGGQNRNKNATNIRIKHLPTGVEACSNMKSRAQNEKMALALLRSRLLTEKQRRADDSRNRERKSQVGRGMRSDKIRTVAYQRKRVENHLNGKRMKIRDYEKGMVDKLH
jgi:peptide chain release factor 1